MITITQTVDLSLTENLIPAIIHAKQYDSMGRKVLCSIYQGSTLVSLASDTVISVSGTRPDGQIFQYGSISDPEVVYVEGGKVAIWITDAMTGVSGRVAVDVTITDSSGSALGSFSFILRVERASLGISTISTGSYSGLVAMVAGNIADCYIDDNGYLVIVSEDGLGLTFSMDDEGNITVEYGGAT